MIHLDRFGWRFEGSECWALREVSLQIARGEFVAIAGTSGSGKTSLALAACGLLVGRHAGDTEGSIRIADHDVLTTPLHQVSESIALVQQNPEAHFATLTVDDEVAFGLENRGLPVDEILARRAEAMELLSITHLAGRTLATLSGGEQQRVAVASVVAGHPEALILDEPTASLDPQASRDLFHTLAALCREKKLTVVIVEHKLAHLLPLKPRLVVLEDGRVVTDVRDSVSTACPSYLADPDPGRLGDDLSTRVETTAQPLVEVSDMTVELGGSTILRDIDLTIRPGEVVALLGPNGGGKSTLLHCLMGLVQPVRGTIRVCDVDVTPTVVSRLAQRVGVVFQNADHQLVADTVWNELLFAVRNLKPPGTAEEPEAARLLKTAGLAARSEDHPYRLSWGTEEAAQPDLGNPAPPPAAPDGRAVRRAGLSQRIAYARYHRRQAPRRHEWRQRHRPREMGRRLARNT